MTLMETTTATSPKQTASNIRADLTTALPSVAATVMRRGTTFRVELRPTVNTVDEGVRAHRVVVNVLRANGVTRDFVIATVAS